MKKFIPGKLINVSFWQKTSLDKRIKILYYGTSILKKYAFSPENTCSIFGSSIELLSEILIIKKQDF